MTTITTNIKPSKSLNISLWIAQVLLAALYGMTGVMKTTQPIDALAEMLIWPGVFPEFFVRFVGLAELAGAIGLILPMLVKIQPRLTIYAASGLAMLQIFAPIWHASQGEFAVLPVNAVLLALAVFIAWGRKFKLPL